MGIPPNKKELRLELKICRDQNRSLRNRIRRFERLDEMEKIGDLEGYVGERHCKTCIHHGALMGYANVVYCCLFRHEVPVTHPCNEHVHFRITPLPCHASEQDND